ncbi:MAG TPA: low specificity L-threonine aldolase [Opitutaceae bacterium]|nr:low specificity L-threonine aldolase [Opitutaceae bacterium]
MLSKDAQTASGVRPDAIPGGRYEFSSDNTAAICPEAWAELERANRSSHPSYGNDPWTGRAAELIRGVFDTDCDVYLVYSGTAANALALSSICRSHNAILVHENAHASVDECGAPEFFTGGSKLITIAGENAKLQPCAVEAAIAKRNDLHFPKVRALSLTQATELGTVYQPAEVAALSALAHSRGMGVHMDGARFANSVDSTGAHPAEITWKAGVDVLSFGGTKNGIGMSEAVVFFNRELAAEFDFRCKQAGQLASKMRFVAAQWVGLLESGAWLRNAAHANTCARRLAAGLGAIPGISILMPVEANAVFAELPPAVAAKLRGTGWFFYPFIGEHGYRFMCSWSTSPAVIDAFLAEVRAAAGELTR